MEMKTQRFPILGIDGKDVPTEEDLSHERNVEDLSQERSRLNRGTGLGKLGRESRAGRADRSGQWKQLGLRDPSDTWRFQVVYGDWGSSSI